MERSDMSDASKDLAKVTGGARKAYGDISRAASQRSDRTHGAVERGKEVADCMADQASEYVRDARDKTMSTAMGAVDRARGWTLRNYARVASHARANPWLYLGAGVILGAGLLVLRNRSARD